MAATWDGEVLDVEVTLDAPGLSAAGFTTLLLAGVVADVAWAAGEVREFTGPPTTAEAAAMGTTLAAMLTLAFQQTLRPSVVKVANLPLVTTEYLNLIQSYDPDWYGFAITSLTAADLLAAAAWAEVNRKLFVGLTNDAGVVGTSYDPLAVSPDVANALKTAGYEWTVLFYTSDPLQRLDVAAAANRLSVDPDNRTTHWRHFGLIGCSASSLTATEKTNALSKSANLYILLRGAAKVGQGRTSAGRPVDLRITADWARERITDALANLMVRASERGSKLPFDDGGFVAFKDAVLRVLQRGVAVGHFTAADPADAPSVQMPKLADISPEDAEARHLEFTWYAKPAGAVETVGVRGTVSLDLSGVASVA